MPKKEIIRIKRLPDGTIISATKSGGQLKKGGPSSSARVGPKGPLKVHPVPSVYPKGPGDFEGSSHGQPDPMINYGNEPMGGCFLRTHLMELTVHPSPKLYEWATLVQLAKLSNHLLAPDLLKL